MTKNPTGTGASSVTSGSGTQSSGVSPPTTSATFFVCTADRCAALLNCHAPTHPECKDGKCACLADENEISRTWNCTEETKKECSPCPAPQEVACSDEKKCICTQPPTTLTTSTKPPPPPPATTKENPPPPPPSEPTKEPPLTKLEIAVDEDVCRDPFDHPGTHEHTVREFAFAGCQRYPHEMRSGSEGKVFNKRRNGGGGKPIMYMAVSWIEGCRTTVDSQDPRRPLAEADEGTRHKEIDCVTATWGGMESV
ncbi:hypothetical protein PG997_008963 [Apiospora hydei]|uniref:Uncharacterized protein n=1 Tax=Apiospora hydei TaxID=1337664 RepID=A0ABR1WC99_9PEZI